MTTSHQSALVVATPGDLEVVFTRRFSASRSEVFNGFVDPAIIRQWLLGRPGWTMPVCEHAARLDGTYRFGWQGPNGETRGMSGEILEYEAPGRMVSTERYDGEPKSEDMLIRMDFTAVGGGTELQLGVRYPSPEKRSAALAEGMPAGMESAFNRLQALLSLSAG